MPWPGVPTVETGVVEAGLIANSEPSVSMTEPSEVNVARPGIGTTGVPVCGKMGVKVNCHDPVKPGVAAAADVGRAAIAISPQTMYARSFLLDIKTSSAAL
jgi:hypothetical protein